MNDRAKRSPPAERSEVVNNSAAGPRASLRKARFVVSRSYEDCVKDYRLGEGQRAVNFVGICGKITVGVHSHGQHTVLHYPSHEGFVKHRAGRWPPSKSLRELRPTRALYQVDW